MLPGHILKLTKRIAGERQRVDAGATESQEAQGEVRAPRERESKMPRDGELARWYRGLMSEAEKNQQEEEDRARQEERRMGRDGKFHRKGSFTQGDDWHSAKADEAICPRWKIEECFGQNSLNSVITNAFVPAGVCDSSGSALAFFKALGNRGVNDAAVAKRMIAQKLSEVDVIGELADAIVVCAVNLVASAAPTGEALNDKYASEASFMFDYGGKADFFAGLEDRVGSPSIDIWQGMVTEHCRAVDSHREWTTGNYGITTTSQTELLFVLSDLWEQLDLYASELGATDQELKEWAAEAERLKTLISPDNLPKEWPHETKNGDRPRASCRQDRWLNGLASMNQQLLEANEKPLLLAEAVGLCLYTGPLFEKYNNVCRGGPLNGEPNPFAHSKFVSLCGASGGGQSQEGAAKAEDPSVNRYPTTIHVISSALVKASKLSFAETVVRGTTGGRLPRKFWEADATGVKGGVEFGFLSTTTNREVAMQYASGTAGTLLEIEMGMIDKGADLSWVSQYPHEKELCFPPLTNMQVQGTRVEGSVLVVSIRLNLNLLSLTIDEVIGKRRKIASDMCRNLEEEAKKELRQRQVVTGGEGASAEGFEDTILSRLAGQLGAICSRDAESFNSDSDFQAYLRDALELKQAAVQAMGLLDGSWTRLAAEAQTAGPTMRRLLAEEGPKEAQDALRALERLAATEATASSTDAKARAAACGELAASAREDSAAAALPPLAGLTEDPDADVRLEAALALPACCGSPELAARVAKLLAELVKDSASRVREAVAKGLPACCEQGGREVAARVTEVLAELARDSEPGIRKAAVEGLPACCERGGPEIAVRVTELLSELAKVPELGVGDAAFQALLACCERGDPQLAGRIVDLLAELGKDSEPGVRDAAFRALQPCCKKIRPEGLPEAQAAQEALERLVAIHAEARVGDKRRACEELAAFAPEGSLAAVRALPLLAGFARDSESGVRSAAFRALTACCEQGGSELAARVQELLTELSKDPQAGVRKAAAEGLIACCARGGLELAARVVELLAGLAKDSEEGVRIAAAQCLPACSPELAARVEELLTGLSKDSEAGFRKAAAKGLAACCKQGGPELAARVKELLTGLSKDSEPGVRQAAVEGLPACCEQGGPEIASRVAELLARMVGGDPEESVRLMALWALARLRADSGGPPDEFPMRAAEALAAVTGELNFRCMGVLPRGADASPAQWAALGDCLRRCARLETLGLGECGLGSAGAAALAGGGLPPGLRDLRMQGNGLSEEGARAVARALPSLPGLTWLDLNSNGMGDEGSRALAVALPSLPELQVLDLSGNGIGDEGARAVAGALPSLPGLKDLQLFGNCLSDAAFMAVRRAAPAGCFVDL